MRIWQSWTGKNKLSLAPNIVELMIFCEAVCVWAKLEVIASEKDNRLESLERVIRVAMGCRDLHNQYAQAQIFAALDSPSLRRFKDEWAILFDKKKNSSAEDFQSFMKETKELLKTERNFEALRGGMWNLAAPAIPYLGVFLKDAFMLDELLKKSKIGKADPKQTNGLYKIYKTLHTFRQASPCDFSPTSSLFLTSVN